MGLGNMLGKLFKKENGTSEQKRGVLSPENALSDETELENIYETASLEESGSEASDSSEDTGHPSEAQALEKEESAESQDDKAPAELSQESVLTVLSEVYDPEIPIDIVNLGLIYGVDIEGSNVHIRMTMTAPGCPASTQIAGESKLRVEEIPGVDSVEIEIVWDPPWDPSKMSEEAQESLGMF